MVSGLIFKYGLPGMRHFVYRGRIQPGFFSALFPALKDLAVRAQHGAAGKLIAEG